MLLREWKLDTPVLDQTGLLRPNKQVQKQIGCTLKRGAAPKTHKMFIDKLLLTCRKPCYVKRQRGKTTVKVPQFAAREHAEDQGRERLNRVLHLVHERTLQTQHIGRQSVVENLPAPIVEHLVAKGPAAQDRIEIFAARAFAQKTRSGLNPKFVHVELFYECKCFSRELAQRWPPAQRTLIARRERPIRPYCSDNHKKPYVGSEKLPASEASQRC